MSNLAAIRSVAHIPNIATALPTPSPSGFIFDRHGKGFPTTIRDSASGKVLGLKGYGALSGEFAVRKGVDLSKPIYEQAAKIQKKRLSPRPPS